MKTLVAERGMNIRDGFIGTVGDTPLIKLRRASEETGCTILGKAEFLNPGGSVKDRAALFIIKDAEDRGLLSPGGVVVEGTAGNTGIGLALVGNARGYRTVIVMPETQSQEKKDMLRLCGVDLRLVPAVPYANPMNYARYSGRLAEEIAKEEPNGVIWANQFDNLANRRGHYETTGPEIWAETEGKVDGFTCSMGTGGTLSGVGIALKERNRDVKIYLSDPMGSGFYNWYVHREWKPEGNSITEGIGNNHETGNIVGFAPDGQYQITDAEMLPVLFSLAQEEGLILGGSTGINVAGAIRLAKELGPGHTVVTILADSGSRYQSNLFNPVFLKERSLPTPPWLER
jgi:cysteine synthase